MLTLPRMKTETQKGQSEIVQMRGINWGDQLQDGDLADSLNVSARRFPYLSTRKARAKLDAYSGVTALTAWGKLVAVQGTDLLYDGTVVGTVTAGEKQFAVVNTRLVIWPDKVYLDTRELTVKPLAASAEATTAEFTANTVTLTGAGDLTEKFFPGDGLKITGCTVNEGNNKTFVVKAVTETVLTATTDEAFTAGTETGTITFAREVPDMDFICESENRLWGCSREEQTIYASALGDPSNFNVFEGLSTDSYALAVGTDGDFTGCCKLSSSVLFWKENVLHKMLGSYPAEYQLYQYTVEGLRSGCHKSMQVINEVLFYVGLHGVYAYSGNAPSLISANFGEREISEAAGGNDGDSYYLSGVDQDGVWHLLVYETRNSLWVHEDNLECIDFARLGRELYFLDADGDVWQAATGDDDPDIQWLAQYTPFYETIEGRKTYSKLLLRLELPKGSYLVLSVRTDGGPWRQIGQIVGSNVDVTRVRVPVNRCDKFELKMEGKGPCTVLSFLRELSVGSEV